MKTPLSTVFHVEHSEIPEFIEREKVPQSKYQDVLDALEKVKVGGFVRVRCDTAFKRHRIRTAVQTLLRKRGYEYDIQSESENGWLILNKTLRASQ